MPGVVKRYVVIEYEGKPIFVSKVIEGDSTTYINVTNEAMANLKTLLDEQKAETNRLEKKIKVLQDEVKVLKGED